MHNFLMTSNSTCIAPYPVYWVVDLAVLPYIKPTNIKPTKGAIWLAQGYRPEPSGELIIEVVDLRKSYGRINAVDGVSFGIATG